MPGPPGELVAPCAVEEPGHLGLAESAAATGVWTEPRRPAAVVAVLALRVDAQIARAVKPLGESAWSTGCLRPGTGRALNPAHRTGQPIPGGTTRASERAGRPINMADSFCSTR